ncbi:MAG: response regulator [Legionella sp.]
MAEVQMLELLELVASTLSVPVYWHDINGMLLGSNNVFRQIIAAHNQENYIIPGNYEGFGAEQLRLHNDISMENIAGLSPYYSVTDAALHQTDGKIIAIVGSIVKHPVTKTEHMNKDRILNENQNRYRSAQLQLSDAINNLLNSANDQDKSKQTYKQCNELFAVLNDIFNKIQTTDSCAHEINTYPIINAEHQTHEFTSKRHESVCTGTNTPLPANTPLSFLLVEDNPVVLTILKALISRKGHNPTSVIDGETALRLIKNNHFDMIITDVGLPGISGIELTVDIRAWEKKYTRERQLIIGLTGHEQAETHIACLNSGMDKVFIKPATTATIDAMIDYAYTERKSRRLSNSQILSSTSGAATTASPKELFNLDYHSIFDQRYALQQLNDMSLLLKLVAAYLSDETQNDIKRMIHAYKENNWQQVSDIAHKLKGGALYIGTRRLYYAFQHLEQYHKTGEHLLLNSLYTQAIEINTQTIKVLSSWQQTQGFLNEDA